MPAPRNLEVEPNQTPREANLTPTVSPDTSVKQRLPTSEVHSVQTTESVKHSKSDGNQKDMSDISRQRTCHSGPLAYGARRKKSAGNEQRLQFIDSLKAPRKFFGCITVEPLAFLALTALYIELPSLQDLIYSKICLQTVSQKLNITHTIAPVYRAAHDASSTQAPTPFILVDFDKNLTANEILSLNASGKILDGGRQSPVNQISLYEHSKAHSLCDRLKNSSLPDEIQHEIGKANAAFWLQYQVILCLLCALTSPYWGGMSDRIGRLMPMNVPIVTAIFTNLASLAFGILISLDSHASFDIYWLLSGCILTGLSGGQAVVIVNSFSFLSDNTSSQSRSKQVVALEAVILVAHSFGFYLNKLIMTLGLAPAYDRPWLNRHFVAFSLIILLNILCLLYSALKLRHFKFHRFLNNYEREQQEAFANDYMSSTSTVAGSTVNRGDLKDGSVEQGSINVDRMRELTSSTPDDLDGPIARADKRLTDWGAFLTLEYYKQTFQTLARPREARLIILLLLLSGFISALCLVCHMSLLYIYLTMEPFNYRTKDYSGWNLIKSASQGSALIILICCMKFIKSWSVPDPLIAALGFLSKGVGLLMIAFAKDSSLIQWSLAAFIFSEYSMPPIRSLLSKLVVKEEVGKIYSCLSAIQSICFLAGNVIFYLVFSSLKLRDFFRISFIVVAGGQFMAVIIMLFVYTALRRRQLVI